MNNKYVLSSDQYNDFYNFIKAHQDLNYNQLDLYEKYGQSPFSKFSWYMEADNNHELIIFNYLLAKWIDKQISNSDSSIKEKFRFFKDILDNSFINISYQEIDTDFINNMFIVKDRQGNLEDNLIKLIGQKI